MNIKYSELISIGFNIVLVGVILLILVLPKQPTIYETGNPIITIPLISHEIGEVRIRSFYRFVEESGKLTPVGSTTFEEDIYLIGASLVACQHGKMRFILLITEKPVGELGTKEYATPPDAQGNAWVNSKAHIYFMLRVNSEKGCLQKEMFMPTGYGFYIRAGETVYFSMSAELYPNETWSAGGTFTLYYTKA